MHLYISIVYTLTDWIVVSSVFLFVVIQKVSLTSIHACLRSQLHCQRARRLDFGTQVLPSSTLYINVLLGMSNSGAGWVCYVSCGFCTMNFVPGILECNMF
jgi:hypothetical protein